MRNSISKMFAGGQAGIRRVVAVFFAAAATLLSVPAQAQCERTLFADVVAFDMPLMWNRLGAPARLRAKARCG